MFGKGTQHTAVEKMPEQFIQQDEPHQVLRLRVERAEIQIYAAREGIVCNLRRNLLQGYSRFMGGSGGAAVHTRRSSHPFDFACTACCKNWVKGSHRHSRRHRCHVALSGLPKGYPLSHLSEVWDTEPHTICRHQQTGLIIRRQRL